MINKKVTYERDIHKSYMKIPSIIGSSLDEKLIFRKGYQGILSMEKSFVNGAAEYWYNISGKQALDVYCQGNSINQDFFERLILRICSQLELLEWNLIDCNCLLVEPEYIFVNHTGEEIYFALYPDTSMDIFEQLQQLAEYLLTKLNHSDREGVHAVYRIYEIILTKKYNIEELKTVVLEMREKAPTILPPPVNSDSIEATEDRIFETKEEDVFQILKGKLQQFIKWIEIKTWKKENKEQIPEVVHPKELLEEEETEVHPTVCLTPTLGATKGMLLYEGMESYPDFQLNQDSCVVGKNPRVKIYIDRETISQFHAKVEYSQGVYYIEDMNSTNGTFVNDKILNYKERQALFPGDVIRFADVKYRFL